MWGQLTAQQQQTLTHAAFRRRVFRGELLHGSGQECTGLLVVDEGMLRSYILSDEGREVTVYRLFPRDICLFSAGCMMRNIQFNLMVEAERDSELWVIPAEIYKQVMQTSAPLANYTNELMAARFSDVMWLIEQIMWRSMDKRLASFLLEESALEGADELHMTHDRIAAHLGTAREVITRMLRYLQGEGMVRLQRGAVTLTDPKALAQLAAS